MQTNILKTICKNMYASRARFVEWMIADSLGTKIMRENNIPLHIIEVSSFPTYW